MGYNRKLAWAALPAIVWACLGLAFALGAAHGEPPPFAMHVGLPPGGVVVPGRLMRLDETADGLHLVSGMPGHVLPRIDEWQDKLPYDLPEGLNVEFIALQMLPPDEQPAPVFNLLDPQAEIRQLPHSKQVVLTQKFIVVAGPFETRLIPRGEDAESRLQDLLEERPHWRPDGFGRRQDGETGERMDRRDWRERWDDRQHEPDPRTPPIGEPDPPIGDPPPPPR